MSRIRQAIQNQKGASLLVVVVIFAIVIIMGGALITITSANYKNSISYHYQKQSYYTARSVMDMVIKGFDDNTQCQALLTALEASGTLVNDFSSSVNLDGLGTYSIKLENKTPTTPGSKKRVKVTVIGNYKDKGTVLTAMLKEGKGDRINPMEFALYAKSGLSTDGSDPIQINGDVLARGALNLDNVEITGNVLPVGGLHLKKTTIVGKLVVAASGGDFKLPASPSPTLIKGKIYTDHPQSVYGRYDLVFDVPATAFDPRIDASLSSHFGILTNKLGICDTIQPHTKPVSDDFISYDGYDVYFSNGLIYNKNDWEFYFLDGSGISFWTDTTYGKEKARWDNKSNPEPGFLARSASDPNTKTCSGGELADFANKTLTLKDGTIINTPAKTITINPTDPIAKVTINVESKIVQKAGFPNKHLDDVSLDANGDMRILSPPSPLLTVIDLSSGGTINGDCILNNGAIGGTVTVNTATAGKDIHIYAMVNAVNMNNCTFNITGDHNVYFYLRDGKPLTLTGTSKIGESSREETQLYVLGMNNTMEISGPSTFKGVAYLDGTSTYKESGLTPISEDRVKGSITATTIQISGGTTAKPNKYTYVEPFKTPKLDMTLTRDRHFIYPQLPTGKIEWKTSYGD